MKFCFHELASDAHLELRGEAFNHIFNARRAKKFKELALCNLKDNYLHFYTISELSRSSAKLILKNSQKIVQNLVPKHIIWALVESKVIEKTLPFLNELGITKLTFFRSQRSQNIELDFNRLNKILIQSCEQCGRLDLMNVELLENLEQVFLHYKNCILLDFSGDLNADFSDIKSIIIGPEGGFSGSELELAQTKAKIMRLDNPLILKSQTAVIFASTLFPRSN
ncbi:MAG: RsmE family RNA methyltransferase [Helicobacter sp.]|nr:RsmE family RNA methyltransferase [Helicobacter sp.]